jgi:hypothetical protein
VLKQKLTTGQQWLQQNITAGQVEISEIHERESLINKQNVDLQDNLRRYFPLTPNQCASKLSKILNQAEDDAIAPKIQQIRQIKRNQ